MTEILIGIAVVVAGLLALPFLFLLIGKWTLFVVDLFPPKWPK